MRVFRDLKDLPKFNKAIVTIGSFDGVHLGHRQLLQKIKTLAKQVQGEDIVVTFHPHPRSIVYPQDSSLSLLNSLEEKLGLFEDLGISNVVVVPFDVSFAQLSASQYIEDFIIKCFDPVYLVVGYDHRFGLNRQGNFDLLQQYEQRGRFKLIRIEKEEIERISISSTKIRSSLNEGNIVEANTFLGRPYLLTGKVISGDRIGSTIGFPTANIKPFEKNKLIPKQGIYAVTVVIHGIHFEGMLYIGNRPTVNNNLNNSIEIHIFDFVKDIYGETVTIHFLKFIRTDIKFDNIDQLKDQLSKDEEVVRQYFADHQKINDPQNSQPKIACVILNYNGEEILPTYLPSVYGSSSDYQVDIVVIDNASTDNSIKYLKEHHPSIKLVQLNKNFGFAQGYNEGLKGLDYDIIALINSDLSVSPNWLDQIIPRLIDHKDLAVIQPTILSFTDSNKYEYAGAAGGFIDILGYPYCRGRLFDTVETINSDYEKIIELDWASGAAMVVKGPIFWEAGGFDGSFFAHMEEIDLCMRIKRLGYSIQSSPSIVYHLGGGTLAYLSPRKTFLNFKNNLTTLVKNITPLKLIYLIPVRLLLDGVAGLRFLLSKQPKHMLAIIKAHFAFYKSLPNTLNAKSEFSKKSNKFFTTSGPKLSILYKYFIKKQKYFSDL